MSDNSPLPPCPCCGNMCHYLTYRDMTVCCDSSVHDCCYRASKEAHFKLCAKLAALDGMKKALESSNSIANDIRGWIKSGQFDAEACFNFLTLMRDTNTNALKAAEGK